MCTPNVYIFINLCAHLCISFPQLQTSAGTIPVWVYLSYSKDSGICFPFFPFKTLEMENVYHKININVNGFSPYRTSQVNHLKLKIPSLTSIIMLHMLNLHFIIIHEHYFSQFTRVIVLLILDSWDATEVRSAFIHFNSWRVVASRLVTRVLRDRLN